ncbi:MAG: GreA/GreB family elongation factor [Candidatus Roizmanbacteria bacterium]
MKNLVKRRRAEFTQSGFDSIVREYAELGEKRKEAVELLSIARDMGDRSENAAYQSARKKLSSIDANMRRLTHLMRDAVIVQPPATDIIGLGSKIEVKVGDDTRILTIVGGYESDIMSGKVSQFSPIGKNLIGKRKNDIVSIQVPAGTMIYTILNIAV